MGEVLILHAIADVLRAGFWVFVIGAGLLLVVRRPVRRRRPDALGRARTILDERYARGEIDRDEYLERRAFLD